MTPRGLELLRSEQADLEAQRAQLPHQPDEAERRRQTHLVLGRLTELATRIASARLVQPGDQNPDEVRFGATVTLRNLDVPRQGEERRLTIVGVDEAEPAQGRIAFTAPIARAILGLGVGDTATLRTGRGQEILEILDLVYQSG